MSADLHRTVTSVVPGSIAEESGILPGDVLLSIDGRPVIDRFDFRMRTAESAFAILVRHPDGEELLVDVEMDEDEEFGLEFDDPLMDECGSCRNDCIFCFIRQLPDGMRPTLYFRDDDLRMSFLEGNYVTLTNLDEAGLQRLLDYHLSPMNISVHTTDPALRSRMMGNRFAGAIMDQLRRIVAAGVMVNAQIVLCRGWNDGEAFDRTLQDLETLGEALGSISAVPVGLTRYRESKGLTPLLPYDREAARDVLSRIDSWRSRFATRRGSAVIHASDELFLRAERPIPEVEYYEDFPQLENGVGLVALFRQELSEGMAERSHVEGRELPGRIRIVHCVTGVDAAPFLEEAAALVAPFFGLEVRVHPVPNRFFGETVTVTGLVTGQDLIHTMQERLGSREQTREDERLLIPGCMLKADEDLFLDGTTLDEVVSALGMEAVVVSPTGSAWLAALDDLKRSGVRNTSGSKDRQDREEGGARWESRS